MANPTLEKIRLALSLRWRVRDVRLAWVFTLHFPQLRILVLDGQSDYILPDLLCEFLKIHPLLETVFLGSGIRLEPNQPWHQHSLLPNLQHLTIVSPRMKPARFLDKLPQGATRRVVSVKIDVSGPHLHPGEQDLFITEVLPPIGIQLEALLIRFESLKNQVLGIMICL